MKKGLGPTIEQMREVRLRQLRHVFGNHPEEVLWKMHEDRRQADVKAARANQET